VCILQLSLFLHYLLISNNPGVYLLHPVFIVDILPPPTPPLSTQILSTTTSKCLVCAPASSPIHLFACPEYAPSSTNYPTSFPMPSITRSCIPSSPPSPLSSYLHPQHYYSCLLHHCFCTWYPLTPTFPQSRMSQYKVMAGTRLASGLCSRLLL
jgi:hypothetical protein